MTAGPLERFSHTAQRAADVVIDAYSTSFGVATRLLAPHRRAHIRAIYALVRVADEIVDGVAAQAGLSLAQQRATLDRFEESVETALQTGYSPDVVVHAFAHTAREVGIGPELTAPFFASMRMDLDGGDAATGHDAYVYGSAEVIGLMCLKVFIADRTVSDDQLAVLERGARSLGAAFQDVNFLRDLADDAALGRSYLTCGARLDEVQKAAWVASVRQQLAEARESMPLLPADVRAAVRSAHDLFAALADKVERTPVEHLYRHRVRVSDARKALIVARAWAASKAGR